MSAEKDEQVAAALGGPDLGGSRRMGMVLFLASLAMLFGASIAAFAYLRLTSAALVGSDCRAGEPLQAVRATGERLLVPRTTGAICNVVCFCASSNRKPLQNKCRHPRRISRSLPLRLVRR